MFFRQRYKMKNHHSKIIDLLSGLKNWNVSKNVAVHGEQKTVSICANL